MPNSDMLYGAIVSNTAALQAQTAAINRQNDLLQEQNSLLAATLKVLISHVKNGNQGIAISEAKNTLIDLGYDSPFVKYCIQ